MSNLFAPIRADIDEVRRQLEESWKIKGKKPYVSPRLSFWDLDLIPALTILITGLYHRGGPQVIALASMLESIHLANRVHDNIKPNPSGPTLWGDYLYARFFELVCSEGNFSLLAPLAKLICSIHLSGVKKSQVGANSEQIVAGEKGNLVAETARLSGLLAGCNKQEEARLRDFGFCLGMCWGLEEINPAKNREYAAQACALLSRLPSSWQRRILEDTVAALTAADEKERSLAL